MKDHDPRDEYALLAKAGLGFREILRMLTTTPATRFKKGSGALAVRGDADLVVLDGDPARDVAAWTRVRMAMCGGEVIFVTPTRSAPGTS